MDTKSIIKYVLIAGGVYVLYIYLRDNGYLAKLGIGPPDPTAAAPQVGIIPATGTTTSPIIAKPAVAVAKSAADSVEDSVWGSKIDAIKNWMSTHRSDPITLEYLATVPTLTTESQIRPFILQTEAKIAASTSATSPVAIASSTRDLVAQLAKNDSYLVGGKMPFEHWNFYYNGTPAGKTKPAPAPGDVGVDPSVPITVDQWWSVVSANGIAGLGLSALSQWQPNPWMV